MKRARRPLVEVRWRDSVQLEGGDWMEVSEVEARADDLMQRSVGFVVAESPVALAIARSISEWDEDGAVEKAEGVLVIPKDAIVERR